MSNILYDNKLLKDEILKCFIKIGCESEQASNVTEAMISTSLNGTDSHGINLFPHYYRALEGGRVKKNPEVIIIDDEQPFFKVDANHAFGHHAGVKAIDIACKKAVKFGISAASVINSTHFGAAGYFSERAAYAGFVGLSFCNADSLVRQPDSFQKFLGTNPLSISVPLDNEAPMVFDMATSFGNWNKVRNAAREGITLPEGMAADVNGIPTNDPNLAFSLEPSGGYKGFGLGVMVDILCGALSGSPFSNEIGPMFTEKPNDKRNLGQFYLVINQNKFNQDSKFKERMTAYLNIIRSLSPKENDAPKAPGDIEKLNRLDRLQKGIPVPEVIFEEFINISKDFNRCVIK
jgi:LDH2 family malate/lactate/ureidoglycolate dehydrogenase